MRVGTLKSALLTALLTGIAAGASLAQEMTPPRITSAKVDWAAALASLTDNPELRTAALASKARHGASRLAPRPLARLNAAMATRFPGVAQSPVPVLLPFDTEALLHDLAEGTVAERNERYLSGFRSSNFFYPGPSGYDAVFSLRTDEVEEFSDIKYPDPIDVLISGSVLLYELEDPTPPAGAPVPTLEALYPGVRRLIHEHHLRYTFVRYGVPYIVSAPCFSGTSPRYKMPTCRVADRVLLRFLQALRVAGGTPRPSRVVEPLAIERPTERSPTFSYHRPGRLLPDTGFRSQGGRVDTTVYSQIRFPLADAPAFANSQMFQKRNRPLHPGQEASPNHSYPWRDNFCERRGFPVGQCPAGIGHQGQDIRPPPCPPPGPGERCNAERNLVAVRDGAILRRPKQEALYLFVNTANEHVRFRYLHMLPRKMDENNLLSGRFVHEGEVIAQVGNFSRKEGGTSYHLHFDVQVPTSDGWVFVNPYMTLVAAYERLIGGRGEAITEPVAVATVDPASTAAGPATAVIQPEQAQPPQRGERASKKNAKHAKHHKRKKFRLARR